MSDRRESLRRFQQLARQALEKWAADMSEEDFTKLMEMLRAKGNGHARDADLFCKIREEELGRRAADPD
jgi:hypothetical protein